MENFKPLLDLSDDQQLKWKGNFEDLKTLVRLVLEAPDEDAGEVSEDKLHKAFTYKIQDVSVRFYTSTGNLKLYGSNYEKLREALLELLSVETTVEVSSYQPNNSTILISDDHTTKPLYQKVEELIGEVNLIKRQVFKGNEANEEIEKLKQEIIIHKETIKHLQNERENLLATIGIITHNNNFMPSFPHGAYPFQSPFFGTNQGKQTTPMHETEEQIDPQTTNNNSSAKGKKRHKKKKKQKSNEAPVASPDENETIELDNSHKNRENRKTTIIVGDSIISKLDGWRMSNKDNHVVVRPFPGATADDLKDYIKPLLRRKPNSMILHIGTNNLRNDIPSAVTDKIVEVCESIENALPECKIAVSEITTRQDSSVLETARIDVNKRLASFCSNRGWTLIKHKISTKELNEKGLHLNRAGIGTIAKDFNNHIKSNFS